MEFRVSSETYQAFAAQFWKYAGKATVFAFHGNMGAGKTTLITALCREKGVKEGMSSPTFSIINEYRYEEEGRKERIYHIDLYRLRDDEEVVQTGVEDCIYSGSICLVEWAEKAPWLFSEDAVDVFIEPLSETERSVSVKLPFPR
jgi:tRNA threonylcarbamoyladenosine biosynthesis protein TsaE